ncbi:MAG TPA: tail fiber domain-containing protein [Xanthobacteraceae bacterium]|nr:tail fiber domain-containing protein [Xanthobacteraceae bacterium]
MEETKKQTTTQQLPAWLEDAAKANVGRVEDYASKGPTPYTGDFTAGLTDNQKNAFSLINAIAGSSNPYLSDIEGLYSKFANAPASSITPTSLLGGGVDIANASISDYMSPYIQGVLDPQLQDISRQGVNQRQALNAQATMDGAFGDARSGIQLGAQQRDEDILRSNTIGKAYADAFSAASGLRAQDVANLTDAQKTNANLSETALQRAITGGKAFQDLDSANVNRDLSTADALAKAGATEQATNQADLTAKYNEFLRQQGWDADTIKLLSSVLATTPYSKTEEKTVEEANNSGFGILGSIAGAIFSDRRVKTDVSVVGALYDGTPVYLFRYIGDDAWRIGLMAQDVEKTCPAAVTEINGVKAVNYKLATENSLTREVH